MNSRFSLESKVVNVNNPIYVLFLEGSDEETTSSRWVYCIEATNTFETSHYSLTTVPEVLRLMPALH